MPFQFFDRDADLNITWRRLPHWQQAGVACFITWRTADSIPRKVLHILTDERDQWLRQHDLDPHNPAWQSQLRQLPTATQNQFRNYVSERWNDSLDECHGGCVLRTPELAKIVYDSLLHFDHDWYEMGDFVVMPNHVHLLAAFPGEDAMLKQCQSWKRYTATQINKQLGQRGQFWQEDGFDHLLRSPEQLDHYQKYIAENPDKANLNDGEFLHYRAM